MAATSRALRDSMHASNHSSPVARLPLEVLSGCFSFLHLHDGITASHVCRAWRAAAISTPQVWSTLKMNCSNANNFKFVVMVLSRSGCLANLRLASQYPTPADAFDAMLLPRLHKIRSLEWHSPVNMDSLRLAAPFLEKLSFPRARLDIPDDFLGGQPANFRSFRCVSAQLPACCHALVNLREIRIDNLDDIHAASFSGLFDLCPRLESLTLCGLRAHQLQLLPSGPIPASLRKLSLLTTDPQCDLMQQFLAWDAPTLRSVSLDMIKSDRENYWSLQEPFLSGTQVLSIREPSLSPGTWILGVRPNGREHAIGVPKIFVPRLAELLVGARDQLQRVHTLNITIDVLEHFYDVVDALPALKNITIQLESMAHAQAGERDPEPELPGWCALACVKDVLYAAPRLETLFIDVRCSWTAAGCGANADDAVCILEFMDFLQNWDPLIPLPDIRIRGFLTADLLSVDVRWMPVRFESVEDAGYPEFWPFEAEYEYVDY